MERETRLVVNIPLYYKKRTGFARRLIIIRFLSAKRRFWNGISYYEVTVEVNVPGATEILKPEELEPVNYTVQAWDETIINVGGETDRPKIFNGK